MAWKKLKAAQILFDARDWDHATYFCGYAVEFILKARICVDQALRGFPETPEEFKAAKPLSLKEHDLEKLLSLTKQSVSIKTNHLKDWSICLLWNPSTRYKPVGTATENSAQELMHAAELIVRAITANPGLEAAVVASTDNVFVKLWAAEKETSLERGSFNLFATWHRSGSFEGTYDLVVSAPWINAETQAGAEHIHAALQRMLKPEELAFLSGVIVLDKQHPIVRHFNRAMRIENCCDCKFARIKINEMELENMMIVTSLAA